MPVLPQTKFLARANSFVSKKLTENTGTFMTTAGITGLWLGNLRKRDHWGHPDVDGRIILRWIFRKWEGVVGTGWSWLRDRWRALLNTVRNLRFPKMREIS